MPATSGLDWAELDRTIEPESPHVKPSFAKRNLPGLRSIRNSFARKSGGSSSASGGFSFAFFSWTSLFALAFLEIKCRSSITSFSSSSSPSACTKLIVSDANLLSVKFQNLLIRFVDITNLVILDAAFHIFQNV